MTILLVGGRSALAQALLPSLIDLGEVFTAGREKCDIRLDLTWPLKKVVIPQGTEVVINTASSFYKKGGAELCSNIEVNVLGVAKLCATAIKAGVKHFVNVSSINATLPKDSAYFDGYALTKRQGDAVVELLCRSASMPFTVLRPSQLYGHPNFSKKQLFLYNTIEQALSERDIVIYGKRAPLRNYLHIDDLSKVIRAVVEKKPLGVFQCINPQNSSFKDIAHAAIDAANSKSRIVFDGRQGDIPDNIFPFENILYEKLGLTPAISMQDGIKREVLSRTEMS
jgi:nucleoside-diphosphate-sugar epimerase